MKLAGIKLKNKLFLAPMAGYSNLAYRAIAREFGCALAFTEMISAKAILQNNKKTYAILKTDNNDRPLGVQLFGNNPDDLTDAAKKIEDMDICDLIDINMGCPVKKILRSGSGAVLLKDLKLVAKIAGKITGSLKLPVSAKIRIGWDKNSINGIDTAKALEDNGISFITVHARTASVGYSGEVNIESIAEIKDRAKIPVIGNGNISNFINYENMITRTGCDGVMIGRATMGAPWVFQDILEKKDIPRSRDFIINIFKKHCDLYNGLYRFDISFMKKLGFIYLKNFAGVRELRIMLAGIKTKEEFENEFLPRLG